MSDTVKDVLPGESPRKQFTQQQVEDFIMLCAQNDKPWFKVVMLDDEMANDKTALALMKSITDVIYNGMMAAEFEERMSQAESGAKGENHGTH